jgi:uncharacterized membrane protein YjfL (UPF0719 family)
MSELGLQYLISTVVYSVLGFVLFVGALYAIEKITRFSVSRKVVEEGNSAVAIVVASIVIAMGIIISAAIH